MTYEDRIVLMVSKMSEEDIRTELAYLLTLQSTNKSNDINTCLKCLLKRVVRNK